jgi:putative phosphonate transport system ATP-binding protein
MPARSRYDGQDVLALTEAAKRRIARSEWGFVHQNARDGLRMGVSAGGNIGERLMAPAAGTTATSARPRPLDGPRGDRPARIDEPPRNFSGGMQQRLQIACCLVTRPRLVFLDEPTGGLDVSVQARLLDLLRGLVADLGWRRCSSPTTSRRRASWRTG